MDGGTVWDVNIDSAINNCLAKGYPEDKIILDVLICGKVHPLSQTVGTTIHNYQDAHHIRQLYNDLNAVQGELDAYPNIKLRYFIEEHNTGCGSISQLDFNNSTTWCL